MEKSTSFNLPFPPLCELLLTRLNYFPVHLYIFMEHAKGASWKAKAAKIQDDQIS